MIFERSKVDAAKTWLSERLPEDAWIETHPSELHVRRSTEIMDPGLDLAEQIDVVRQALDGIEKLENIAKDFIGSSAS